MKKVLFATTALIATAGVAAAEVRFSGYGRFGLDYNDANGTTSNGVSSTTITSRLRLQVDMTTETDGGVQFIARYRAQAESRDNNPGAATFNGGQFGVAYGGLRVNVGNIWGAIDSMPGLYLETRSVGTGIDGAGFWSVVANVNDEFFNFDSYSSAGAGNNGVEAIYTVSGFTGHISYSKRNDSNFGATSNAAPGAPARGAIALSYNWNDITVAAAYQDSDFAFENKAIVTAAYDGGNWGVRAAYADNDGIGKWGLYGNVDIGAASNLVAWVADEEAVSAADVAAGRSQNRDGIAGSTNSEGTSYGLNYSYDLGGGVSLEAGYRRASNDNDTFQAGAWFSF